MTDFEDDNAYARAVARGFVTPSTARVAPKPAPAAATPIGGGLYNNLGADGGFKLPSIDAADPYSSRRRFRAAPASTPGYITDKATQAEAPTSAAPTRRARGPAQLTSEGNAGFSAPNVGNPDDRERKAAMSDIDSKMFALGSLNMRSKRDLFGQMLGLKTGLTTTGFNADNERVQTRARIGAQAAEANAQLAEAGARRRNEAGMFNIETGEKRRAFDVSRYDQMQSARAAAAAENDPTTLKNRLLLAKENREQANFEAGIPGKVNAQDNAEIAAMIKEGMTREAAESTVLDRRLRNGENPRGSRASAVAYDTELSEVDNAINETGANMWATRALAGDGYAPFDYGQAEPITDYTQLEVEPLSPINPVRMFSDKNNRVKARGADGKEFTTYATDEKARELRRRMDQLKRGGR